MAMEVGSVAKGVVSQSTQHLSNKPQRAIVTVCFLYILLVVGIGNGVLSGVKSWIDQRLGNS